MAEEATAGALKTIRAKVQRMQVEMDPPLDIFNIELMTSDGVWTESFGSEEALRTFLRGVEAGCALGGRLEIPEIPRRPTDKFVSALAPADEG
jgi:hypothetical protein